MNVLTTFSFKFIIYLAFNFIVTLVITKIRLNFKLDIKLSLNLSLKKLIIFKN